MAMNAGFIVNFPKDERSSYPLTPMAEWYQILWCEIISFDRDFGTKKP